MRRIWARQRVWRGQREYHTANGTIKRLIRDRGFGFIQLEEGQDIFFHYNDLQGEAYESLTEGQQVEFEVTDTPKGPRAVNVRLAGESG